MEFGADSSDAENNGGNLPKILIKGNIVNASTITIGVTGGNATLGSDYTLSSTVVNIPSGNYDGTSATGIVIPLSVINDAKVEPNETINFNLSNPTGDVMTEDANGDSNTDTNLTYTINNDDTAGVLITPNSATVSEDGTTATFNVKLSSEPSADVVISLVSSDTTEATIDKSTLTFNAAN